MSLSDNELQNLAPCLSAMTRSTSVIPKNTPDWPAEH